MQGGWKLEISWESLEMFQVMDYECRGSQEDALGGILEIESRNAGKCEVPKSQRCFQML